MQINPLTRTTEVSGTTEARTDVASKPVDKIEKNRSLPSEDAQHNQDDRLKDLKQALAQHDITLNYSQDAETNRVVIKLVDDKTGEAIRQIPTEVSLKLSAQIQGQFLDLTI